MLLELKRFARHDLPVLIVMLAFDALCLFLAHIVHEASFTWFIGCLLIVVNGVVTWAVD